MGPDQAATVMEIITREKMQKRGMPVAEEFVASLKEELIKNMTPKTTVLYGTARLWDDGVIDPVDTRRVLGLSLATVNDSYTPEPEGYGVFRM